MAPRYLIRYRGSLRDWLLTLAVCACSKDAPAPSRAYPDPAAALAATISAEARVIGFGELHARRDRAPANSTLAAG